MAKSKAGSNSNKEQSRDTQQEEVDLSSDIPSPSQEEVDPGTGLTQEAHDYVMQAKREIGTLTPDQKSDYDAKENGEQFELWYQMGQSARHGSMNKQEAYDWAVSKFGNLFK